MEDQKPSRPQTWRQFSETLKRFDCKDDWRTPFRFVQWICEWLAYWADQVTLFKVLDYVAKLGILIAAITYLYPGCSERRQAAQDSMKSRHYVAWQTINSAVGKPGNAGRNDALQDLNHDGIPLDGISLAGGVVLVGPLNLTTAKLTHADLSDGVYESVNFSGAELYRSKWDNALCEGCDFRGAQLNEINFNNVTFEDCNFAGVNFHSSTWTNVAFYLCNFAFADFSSLNIGANVYALNGNLFNSSNASLEFVEWASKKPFDFTNVVTLTEWRNAARPLRKRWSPSLRSEEFQAWATNQWVNREGWLEWSHTNLNNY